MEIDIITIEDIKKFLNSFNIGHPIIYCSVNDLKILQDNFPQLNFTQTSLIEENTIMLIPDNKIITYRVE